MLAKDIMSEGVTSVLADATLLEAATYLVNARVSAMPVLDKDGVLVGIVTEADLIPYAGLEAADDATASAAAISSRVRQRTVKEVMTKNVITIDQHATLKEVVVLMAGKRLKRLPVRGDGSIVGIISRIDLLKVIISRAGLPESAAPARANTRPMNDDDVELRRTVLQALKGQVWSTAERLDVVVIGDSIHLWGVVPNQEVLRAYLEAAQNVAKGKDVVSHMQILRQGYRQPFGVVV